MRSHGRHPLDGPPTLSAGARSAANRLPLSGTNPRRLPFERRLRLWLLALTLPAVLLAPVLAFLQTRSVALAFLVFAALALTAAVAGNLLFDQITRPLHTLVNVVAALREDDFSFRARGARRGDALGDLALEVNALATTLQTQRSSALDALTLVERVLTSMPSPVLAFDSAHQLRLLNPAAAAAFALHRQNSLSRSAHDLRLHDLLAIPDHGLYTPDPDHLTAASPTSSPGAATRWSVRRTTFRLHGVPHTLFVLADVAAALREEERLAWQRLIRVLGHEINNSLTPIKSIAGSLRAHLAPHPIPAPPQPSSLPQPAEDDDGDGATPVFTPTPSDGRATHSVTLNLAHLDRGLAIIEDRAESLNRFLQAYQRLSRLPAPDLRRTALAPLANRVAALETRLSIRILPSADLGLLADPDQLQQLLINLLRNAVDAALSPPSTTDSLSSPPESLYQPHVLAVPPPAPEVTLAWYATADTAILQILDNGPGLINPANLFVPFYTTKPGGSGIGLVLAQGIVSAHGGTLTLTNRPQHTGCQAEIRLPLASEQSAADDLPAN